MPKTIKRSLFHDATKPRSIKKTVAKIDDVDEKYIVFNPLFIKD